MHNSTLCYLVKDGKVLMLHRVKKKNDINHDKWIGIGGKFEPEEAPEEPEDKPQTLDRDSLDALLEEIRNMEP